MISTDSPGAKEGKEVVFGTKTEGFDVAKVILYIVKFSTFIKVRERSNELPTGTVPKFSPPGGESDIRDPDPMIWLVVKVLMQPNNNNRRTAAKAIKNMFFPI